LLRESEHWTQEQFEQYQARRLTALLRHCASEVPHYAWSSAMLA